MKKSSAGYLKNKGFTLIELMITISLIGFISVVGIASFVNFNRSQTLQTGANDFVTALNFAKASAASQVKPKTSATACKAGTSLTSYQVIINTNSTYSVVAVCTDGQVVVSNSPLPKDITFSAGDVSKNISFSLLTGGVGANQVTINGYSQTKIINIDNIGKITVQ